MSADRIALVRAYDGQPLKRVVVGAELDVLYVANPKYLNDVLDGRCKPVGFRRIDCFAWDDDVFQALARAYAADGHTDPDSWIALPPFVSQSVDRRA